MTRRPHADTLSRAANIVSTQLIFGMLGMLGMLGGVIGKYAYGGPRLSLIVLLGCSRCTTRFRVLTQASWMLCVVHENRFNRALLASHQNEECGGRVVQSLGCGRTCWWSAPVLVKAGCARQGPGCTYVLHCSVGLERDAGWLLRGERERTLVVTRL